MGFARHLAEIGDAIPPINEQVNLRSAQFRRCRGFPRIDIRMDASEAYAAFSRFNSSLRPIISISECVIDDQSVPKSGMFGNDTFIRFQSYVFRGHFGME